MNTVGAQRTAAALVLVILNPESRREREREQGEASRLRVCRRERVQLQKGKKREGKVPRLGHTNVILSLTSGEKVPFMQHFRTL